MAARPEPATLESWIEHHLLPHMLPEMAVYDRPFGKALPWLSLLLLLLLVAMASPPLRDLWLEYWISPAARHSWHQHKAEIVAWIECLRIALEVTIGVAIGGQVFSINIKNGVQNLLDQYQADRTRIISGKYEELTNEIRNTARILNAELHAKITIFQVPAHLWKLFRTSRKLYRYFFGEIPAFQRQMVILSLYSNFPGGLYGVICYFAFLLLVVVKLCKLYMESPVLT